MEDELELEEEVCKGITKMGRRAHQDYFQEENHLSQTSSPAVERPSSKPPAREGVWSGLVGASAFKSKKKPAEQEIEDHRLRQQSSEAADDGGGSALPTSVSYLRGGRKKAAVQLLIHVMKIGFQVAVIKPSWLSAGVALCAGRKLLRRSWMWKCHECYRSKLHFKNKYICDFKKKPKEFSIKEM
ncbi:intraflagellar transport protein 43 homolog isoform X3 [Pogona vitticeps]